MHVALVNISDVVEDIAYCLIEYFIFYLLRSYHITTCFHLYQDLVKANSIYHLLGRD